MSITENPAWQASMKGVNADRRAGSLARKIEQSPPLYTRDIERLKTLLDEHPRLDAEVTR